MSFVGMRTSMELTAAEDGVRNVLRTGEDQHKVTHGTELLCAVLDPAVQRARLERLFYQGHVVSTDQPRVDGTS